jgi:D-alanine-D-alanine ligase-like ATP-grasp enzyme/acylphosphatase
MGDQSATLTLTRMRATWFRDDDGQHFLVQLRGTTGEGRVVDAMGESTPRGATGDRTSASWDLLTAYIPRLAGRTIPLSDPEAASSAVTAMTAEISELAAAQADAIAAARRAAQDAIPKGEKARKPLIRLARRTARSILNAVTFRRRPEPFEGTIRGVEAALVDLVSRALDRPPAAVVGPHARALARNMPLVSEPYDAVLARVLRKVVDFAATPALPAPTHEGRPATAYDEVPYLKPLGSNGTKGHLLEREALALGLTTTRFSKGAFLATDGVQPPLLFKWSRSPRSSAVSLALCTHKEATRMLLDRAGVPVPRGRTFAHGDFDAARAFAARIGYPVVVKPAMGVRGIGVVADIRTEQELDSAFELLVQSRLGKDDFIVEQHIDGRDYRIVVVGDEVIAAILREPASVEGDGEHTVAELMVNKNAFRNLNPHLWGRPIKYEDAARYQLQRAGLQLSSVPAAGQKVVLSNTCSLSQGGDSIDVLDELHSSIRDACLRAVRAVPGLWFCGIDFLIADHTKPLADQRAGICELNAHAAIGNCEYPLYGTPRQVARIVMQQCVEHYGLKIHDKPADHLALRLTIRGKFHGTGVGYHTWLQRHAAQFGLHGWVRSVDDTTLEAVLVGAAVPASALTAAAVLGPRRITPASLSTEHIEPPDVSGFAVLERKPKERHHAQ